MPTPIGGDERGSESQNMQQARIRTLRLANGVNLLSIARDSPEAPTLADILEQIPRHEDVLLNLEGATASEAKEAYAAIVWSRRVRESARPLMVVCGGDALRRVLAASGLERHVLLESSLEEALGYLVGGRWLATFAEVGSYASTRP